MLKPEIIFLQYVKMCKQAVQDTAVPIKYIGENETYGNRCCYIWKEVYNLEQTPAFYQLKQQICNNKSQYQVYRK